MNRIILFMVLIVPLSSYASDIGWRNPSDLALYISQQSHWVIYFAFYGLGVLLAFTPCVLPMVPILSGIIVGQNVKNTRTGFQLSLAYVIGMAITYAVAGMMAGWLGATVQTLLQTPWIILSFSLLFILLGLNLLDIIALPIPGLSGQSGKKQGDKPASLFSVAMMGVMSTLVVSPCVTGPLVGVLTYIGNSGQVFQGGLLLFILALGMGTPLLLVGSGYGKFLPKSGPWMMLIKKLFAYMMFALAIWLSSRILPDITTKIAYLCLTLFAGLTLGLFKAATNTVERFGQRVSVILLLASGGLMGQFVANQSQQPVSWSEPPFLQIHSQADLNRYLDTAKQAHQPVFIEFFAGWCSDCQAMDKQVFRQDRVRQAMKSSLNLRVDISQKSASVDQIRSHFGVVGIPTLLFVNDAGNIQSQLTAVGQIPAESLIANLKAIQNS